MEEQELKARLGRYKATTEKRKRMNDEKPKLTQQEMNDWIMSLNPITIDFDEHGELVDLKQVDQLKDRIESEARDIKGEQQ